MYTNYSYDERSIDNKLQAWENAMDKLAYYESKVAQAAADTIELEQAEKRLELAKILKDEAEASYNDELASKQANLDNVKANVEVMKETELNEVITDLTEANDEQAEYITYTGLTTEVTDDTLKINEKQDRINAINEAKNTDIFEKLELERRQADLLPLIETDPVAKAEYDSNELKLDTLRDRIQGTEKEVTDLTKEISDLVDDRAIAEAAISTYTTIPTDKSGLIAELEARRDLLESDEAFKELIDEAIEELNAVSPTTYNEAKAKYEAAILERDNLLEKTDPMLNYDYQAALNACKSAEDKLAELTGTDGENITAKVAGTVTSVECNAGDKKMKDDVLCTIEVPDQGYTLSFTATNEQASRLRIGDQATVSNFYWGNEVTATLSSIKTDPKNPQNNKLLTFDLEGNVTSGSQLTISVGSKSANYDLIIPSSAIRSDSNGSFVLKVEAKNSPLGNRYIAKRVPVEVLASDDNNSAVTAELQYGDYVITTSSAPIKNGSMVRLANAS